MATDVCRGLVTFVVGNHGNVVTFVVGCDICRDKAVTFFSLAVTFVEAKL